jgi:hypothetical protein
VDERGNPSAGARVYLFPADRQQWKGWMRGSSVSGREGTFRIERLAAGDYLLVAISAEDARSMTGMSRQPRFDRLVKVAERITLLDNDRRIVDLNLRRVLQEPGK